MSPQKNGYYQGYNLEEPDSIYDKVIKRYKEEGIRILLKKIITYSIHRVKRFINTYSIYSIYRINYSTFNKYFNVNKKKYKYYLNTYNAIDNERVVEIPIALEFAKKHKSEKVLEIGNVLSHYVNFDHKIVDKYEIGKGVTNVDITEFNPPEKYNAIISISTIEHVGFDEQVKDPGKASKAIGKIINLLSENGEALITVPLGYNPEIDTIIKNEKTNLQFSQIYYLKRISRLNLWIETTMEDGLSRRYGVKYPHANSIAVIIISTS
ncbi:MAG: hypothetical protein B2I17_02100 [Thermoplasmatales archaeon B_DKE]|nr:MAG: hypothetical protein B2I17_02100 [Thermoplasmatales archaeon B_DKE]